MNMNDLPGTRCILACSWLWAILAGAGAFAGDITRCDLLAANPPDPDRVAPGVERHDVDLPAAIAACEQAVQEDPANVRVRYQLARVLSYAGQHERALAEMRRSADLGYRQAQFLYGLSIMNARPGAPADLCLAEHYWRLSARAGRDAAAANYAIQRLRGTFDDCGSVAAPEEIIGWLQEMAAQAPPATPGYYQRLLAAELAYRVETQP
jgi:uncharacterized protein